MMLFVLVVTSVFLTQTFTFHLPRTFCPRLGLKMAQKHINMPALSSTMKEGKVVSWNKKVGDKVVAGDVLLVVESDKADMDVESFENGYLAAIFTPEGGTAAVGTSVAVIVDEVSEIGQVGSSSPTVATPAASTPTPSTQNNAPAPSFDKILMPALSSTMKEGKVVSWSKKVGDKVCAGDMVLVVESDKADMDVESYEEGYLAAILVGDGQVAPVGQPVCYLAKTKEEIASVAAFAASGGQAPAASVAAATGSAEKTASPVPPTAPAPSVSKDGHVAASGYAKALAKAQGVDLRSVTPSRADQYITSRDLATATASASGDRASFVLDPGVTNASPMARKLAHENSLDVSKIQGTGNFGRVMPEDVLRAAGKLPIAQTIPTEKSAAAKAASPQPSSGKSSGEHTSKAMGGVVAMEGIQKAVAKNMEKTVDTPIFRVTREIFTDKMDALYATLKSKGVSVSAILAKAVAETAKKHPIINAAYVEGGIKFNSDVNVAMAVALDGGLITPTLKSVQNLDLFSISRQWKDLVDKAKSRKLVPEEYSGGTIAISNLGMYGVQQFDAILPYGLGSILAISSSLPKVVQLESGFIGIRKSMMVTITCDHRHIYGAQAAEFLRDLADLLENKVETLTMG